MNVLGSAQFARYKLIPGTRVDNGGEECGTHDVGSSAQIAGRVREIENLCPVRVSFIVRSGR